MYNKLGRKYFDVSDFQKALEYWELCLSNAKDDGDKEVQCTTYVNVGTVYYYLSDLKTAIEHYQQSLSIAKDVGNKAVQGTAYCCIADIYCHVGDLKTAMEHYQQSLSIAKDVGNKAGQGCAYKKLGMVYCSLGNFRLAMEYYQKFLSMANDIGDKEDQGNAYSGIASVYFSLGDIETAMEHYQQSLSIAKDVGDKHGQEHAYYELGCGYHRLGNLETAMEYYQQSLSIAKDIGDKHHQLVVNARLGILHTDLNDLPIAEDYIKSSVELMDYTRQLLHSQDDWKISIRNLYGPVYNGLWVTQLNQNKLSEALSSAERGRAQALMDLMKSKYGLEVAQSSWSANNTEEISNLLHLLPSLTVFLAIGKNSIIFWVLQKGNEVHFRQRKLDGNINPGDEIIFLQSWIEEVCETLKSVKYEDRCLDCPAAEELPVHKSEEMKSLDREKDALKELYNKFVGPIADLLHGDEIIIVPDGPLALVPFSAAIGHDSKYLSETFRIRLIPSLSSLKLMAECPEGYHSATGALLVGNPWVYDEVVINGRCTKLPPLPFAKEEVEMIGKILNTEPLTGKRATKPEVLSRINSVALVHIAAHGVPGTGEIILSPNPASLSESFLLTMKDILNSKLRARLVVLSCCHSGRGEVKAEGVVGIARAFLGAGARSVVVTLWAINDKATQEFMKHFYKHLSEGQCVSKCLHQAMKHLRESDDFKDVKCWAPFVLVGDDITMNFSKIR